MLCQGEPGPGTLPPPPEDAGEYGSICEQNPQLPQCQDGEVPPPDETGPPPEEEAPPPDETAPSPDEVAPPPDETAPPPTGPPSLPPPQGKPLPQPPLPDGKPPSPPPAAKDEAAGAPALPLAVVIAIDDYDNEALTGSPQAISNAAHIVRYLKTDVGMGGDRILTGRNATLSDFQDIFGKSGEPKSELHDLLKKTKTPEVIVYYAGRARALDGGKDVLLLPADADPAKPETGVRLSALYNNLAAMGIRKLRVYLDPVFVKDDDVVKVRAGPVIGPAGLLTPRGWVALSAASDNTPLPRDAEKERSLFTESLVAGLRGIADATGNGDSDGTVSAEELHGFIANQAAAAAKRGDKQPLPSLYGSPTEPLRAY